jgi:hypothetical protein
MDFPLDVGPSGRQRSAAQVAPGERTPSGGCRALVRLTDRALASVSGLAQVKGAIDMDVAVTIALEVVFGTA